MVSLTCCGAIALLIAICIPTLGPLLIRHGMFFMHHPAPWDSSQARWVQKIGTDMKFNDVRGKANIGFITSAQIDYLEKEFPHRLGDVWVTTYQKVGTTWTQYMVHLINGNSPVGLIDLMRECPWLEVDYGIFGQSSIKRKQAHKASAEIQGGPPRCFKSHWSRADHMAKLPAESKVIYVFRDAESVVKSFWAHCKNMFFMYWLEEDELAWDPFFEQFISGDTENGDYFEHVASWWKVRDQPNVLMLQFKDIVKEHAATVRTISKFIGAEISEARVKEIVQFSSLEGMANLSAEDPVENILKWAGAMRGEHIRKPGSKRPDPMTDAQRQRLKQRYEQVLKPLGMPEEMMIKQKK